MPKKVEPAFWTFSLMGFGCLIAMVAWQSGSGEVKIQIANAKLSSTSAVGMTQQIPIDAVNTTATRVRLVGTNAC